MTKSAPRDRGCCRIGVANVLSTMTAAPRSWAAAHTARRSTTSSDGLVGLSTTTAFVRGPASEPSRARSAGGTIRDVTPRDGSTSRTRRVVPP